MSSYNWYPITTSEKEFEQELGGFIAAFDEKSLEEALPCMQEMDLLIKKIRPVAEETSSEVNDLWDDFTKYKNSIFRKIEKAVDLIKVADSLSKTSSKFAEEGDVESSYLLQKDRETVQLTLAKDKESILRLLDELLKKRCEIKEMSEQMSEQPQR
jgi:hypothetical protein